MFLLDDVTLVNSTTTKINPSESSKGFIDSKYILITAASNEEDYIEDTIKSVISQSVLPQKWIIVVNSSFDRTEDIVSSWSEKYPLIKVIISNLKKGRDFALKVAALEEGFAAIDTNIDYRYLGILDADICLPVNYYEKIILAFEEDTRIGIGGGILFDIDENGNKITRSNNKNYVPGGVHFYRKECWEHVGKFYPLKWGGEDTIAELSARKGGWKVKIIDNLIGYHNRKTNTSGNNVFQKCIKFGKQDYHIGVHPLFEIGKCIYHFSERPFIITSLCRLMGYFSCFVKNEKKIIPDELIKYYQKEQMKKLLKIR